MGVAVVGTEGLVIARLLLQGLPHASAPCLAAASLSAARNAANRLLLPLLRLRVAALLLLLLLLLLVLLLLSNENELLSRLVAGGAVTDTSVSSLAFLLD